MPRVLLVDDDAPALPLRQLILERAGHEVHSATSPDQARQLFAEKNPEIIVMDVRLPHASDGLSLIRTFRAQSPQVRIIILAGSPLDLEGTPESQMVDEVIAKPARTAQLLAALL